MKRKLAWILGIAGSLLIVLIIAVYIVLLSYDFNSLKPGISKKVFDSTGRELTIGSDIDLDISLSPTLVLSDIKFQNADWGSRKEMVKINRFEIKVALLPLIKGNIEVKRFILIEPDILIETSKTGEINLEFKTNENALDKASEKPSDPKEMDQEGMKLPSLTVNRLEIINGTVNYKDGKSGKTETVSIKELKADIQGTDHPLNFDLSAAYNNQPVKLAGSLGSINSLNNPEVDWSIEIEGNALDVLIKLKGTIKNPLEQQGINLNFDVIVDKWKRLSEVAGQEIPVKDPLSVSGNITDSAKQAYNIKNLKILLGNNLVEGSLGLDISKNIPYIDFELSSKELDLKPFFEQEKSKEKAGNKTAEKETDKPEKIFPSDPLPLDLLKLVDFDSKIRVGKIISPQAVIDNVAVISDLKNGNLTVKPLTANIGRGDFNLNMSLLSKSKSAVMKTELKVRSLEIGDILNTSGGENEVEGIIDADINLEGQGSSLASIMGSLNGYAAVIMGEGRVSNKYLDMFGGSLSEGIIRLLNPSKDKKEYTAIKCAIARFDMRNGIADTTALVFNTSMMSVIGEGTADLRSEKLDISLNPSTKAGVAGYSLNLGELTKPFKLGGTLAEPSLVLDKQKAALSIGMALGESGLKDILGKGTSGNVDETLCEKATEAAKTGVKLAIKKETDTEKKAEPETPRKIIEDVIKDPGKALKGLFGGD